MTRKGMAMLPEVQPGWSLSPPPPALWGAPLSDPNSFIARLLGSSWELQWGW